MTLKFYVRRSYNRFFKSYHKNIDIDVLVLCYNQMCKKCDENDHESWADIKIQKNEKKDKAKKLYSQLLI